MIPENLFPIGYVAQKTGLSPHVIRAWERRYGAIEPRRTKTNRRLYSHEDVLRLALLGRAVDAGHRISQIAGLNRSDLEALQQIDLQIEGDGRRMKPARHADAARYLNGALDAVRVLDGAELERVLADVTVALPRMAVLIDVIAPLLEKIGTLWADGTLRIAHEHMASAVVQARLWQMQRQIPTVVGAPAMVVAAPSGQWCELGALMVAVVAADCGWQVHYFGPNMPAEEIAAAVAEKKARAAALSLPFQPDARWMAGELEKLIRRLSPAVDLYVGGRGAEKIRRRLEAFGIHCPGDLRAFVEVISGAAE